MSSAPRVINNMANKHCSISVFQKAEGKQRNKESALFYIVEF